MMKHYATVPFLFLSLCANAQWCVPTTAIPYDADMPGITDFVCANIDRTSADLENYPNNSYVLASGTTTLVRGQSYPATVHFTIDPLISPHMNVRLWIDLNHDGQLDDIGETLLSFDHVVNSVTGTVIIPNTAMLGATRLRVTAKMCSHGGHTLPTPCDFPVDPIGYHGEIEDYNINIISEVGIEETNAPTFSAQVVPQPVVGSGSVRLSSEVNGTVQATVMDAAGRQVVAQRFAVVAGENILPLDFIDQLAAGRYTLLLADHADRGRTCLPLIKVE